MARNDRAPQTDRSCAREIAPPDPEALPLEQRQTIAYHYLVGMPYVQVARIVGGSQDLIELQQTGIKYVTRLAAEVESKKGQKAILVQTLERGTAVHHINQNGTSSAKDPYFVSWRSGNWRHTGRTHGKGDGRGGRQGMDASGLRERSHHEGPPAAMATS